MSQENVEQLRAGIETFLAGTSESAREDTLSRSAEGWDPEIELDASETPVLDISGVYRGRDAVKRFWREWLAAWETIRFEYELVDAGDRVVMLFDMRMRGRSTGIDVPLGRSRGSLRTRVGCWSTRSSTWARRKPSRPWGCRSKTLTPVFSGRFSGGLTTAPRKTVRREKHSLVREQLVVRVSAHAVRPGLPNRASSDPRRSSAQRVVAGRSRIDGGFVLVARHRDGSRAGAGAGPPV